MHILIVAPEQIPVPPVMGGSVEVCILSIARKLARTERVTIISRAHPRYPRISHEANLTIIRVPSGNEGAYTKAVLQAIYDKKYDWIQVDNRPRIAAKLKQKYPHTPVSLFLHSMTFVTPPYRYMDRASQMIAKVDVIITNSLSLKQKIADVFPQQSDKVRTVLLGVDSTRFRPPTAIRKQFLRRKYNVHRSFNVLFVGRLIPKKGVEVLLKAMKTAAKQRPNMRLIIVGGAQRQSYMIKLRKMVKTLQVPAVFIGRLPHKQLHRTYWLGDCLVCPSQKHEAFGLVNVEAMASGIPVIASKNGGIKEIVDDHHNGYLIQDYPKSSPFARKILHLAQHSEKRKRMGRQARIDVLRRFSWQRVARDLLMIYKSTKEDMLRKEG
jgi:spore coat protein SA